MQEATSLFVIFTGLIELSFLVNVYPYYRPENSIKPNSFWRISLLLSAVSHLLLGLILFFIKDIHSGTTILNTLANTLNFASFATLVLFCRSLNKQLSKEIINSFIVMIILYGFVFEYVRRSGDFSSRNILIGSSTIIFFCWQLKELHLAKGIAKSHQFSMFYYLTLLELISLLIRVFLINHYSTSTIRSINEYPLIAHLSAWAQLTFNLLAYNSIAAYWAEKITASNTQTEIENQQIRGLLIERDELIKSLTIAEKTAQSGALTASFAHELNQPLGAIKINATHLALISENETNPKKKKLLNSIISDSDRAANIIQSLKQIFSTKSANKTLCDINDIVRRIGEFYEAKAQKEKIIIEYSLKAKSKIMINESEIQQAIINLLNNAIFALEESQKNLKKIYISTREDQNFTNLSVSDNGNGISESMKKNLFDLLKTNRKDGMGIGLWLTKYIIERNGGKIEFETAENLGTTFIINFADKSDCISP